MKNEFKFIHTMPDRQTTTGNTYHSFSKSSFRPVFRIKIAPGEIMKKTFITLSFLLITTVLFAQSSIIKIDPGAQSTLKFIYNQDYHNAFKEINNKLEAEPYSLQWLYLKGMSLYRRWSNLSVFARNKSQYIERDSLLEQMFTAFTKVKNRSDDILKNDPGNVEALFFGGAAYGYIGIYHVKIEELFTAASEGRKGMDYHEKLLEMYPEWTDVYLSSGIFHLYASNVPWYAKAILWILGKSGDENRALEYLSLVSQKGEYTKYEALEMLLELSIRQTKNDKAAEIYSELIRRFPASRFYYAAKAGFESWNYENYDAGINIMKELISRSDISSLNDREKEKLGIVHIILANTYIHSSDPENELIYWEAVVQNDLLPKERPWLHSILGNKYVKLGYKEKAIAIYEKMLGNDEYINYHDKAKTALADLRQE